MIYIRYIYCLNEPNRVLQATASVDTGTDAIIQQTIRTEFEDCTVLTIAHRLETIVTESNLIVVMEDGKVGECGSPAELLLTKSEQSKLIPRVDTVFSQMVDELGSERKQAILSTIMEKS